MKVGERIRDARKEIKLTQAQLAEKIGVSRVCIMTIENSDDPNMTVKTAKALSRVLGKSLDYLLCNE